MAIQLPVNLEDVAATPDFKVADPGQYTLEIKTAKQGVSKAGNTKIDLRLTIIEDDEFAGVSVFDTITITPEALFRLKQYALATGVEIGQEFDPQDFVNEQVTAVLDVEPVKNQAGEVQFHDDGTPKLRNKITKLIFSE